MNTIPFSPVLQSEREKSAEKRVRQPFSPEKFWRQELLRLIYENGVRRWLPSIPQFSDIRGKYLTGRAFFIEADWKRRLLIGSLGWFDHPGRPAHPRMLRIPNGTLYHALWEIQKKIGQVCLDEGLHFRIIIDPSFAEEKEFEWLWHQPRPETKPVPARPSVPSGPIRLTADIPYFLTRALFPPRPLPARAEAYIRHLGEGKYFRVEPTGAAPLPTGAMPVHLLDTLYNIARKNGSPLVSFYDATDLLATLGYAVQNRQRLQDAVQAIAQTRILVTEPMYRHRLDISPFEEWSFWSEPVTIDSLGRRNTGRTPKKKQANSPVFFRLSKAFMQWCESQVQYEVDWDLVNQIKTSMRLWSWYRKAVELGRRNAGNIPLGGKDGLLREFGYNVSTPANYCKSKFRLKQEVAELRRLTIERYGSTVFACPHFVKDDMLYFYPWRPLINHRHTDFPVPEATIHFMAQ